MVIKVYSKPNCKKCESAKKKLELMGLSYEEHSIDYHTTVHKNWRHDRTAEIMGAQSQIDSLPMLEIDGQFYDYPGAMKKLKGKK